MLKVFCICLLVFTLFFWAESSKCRKRRKGHAQPRVCSNDNDCPPNYCCEPPVRGKRSPRYFSRRYPVLNCVKINSRCYVGNRFGCPRCGKGKTCVGTGEREIPQGEIGTCK